MQQKQDKGYKGMAMEGLIASWYARTTAKDEHRHRQVAQKVSQKIAPGSRVLEIAPGPGYFCIELAKLGSYDITGLDISHSFVAIARENAIRAGVSVNFRQGNASAMPFEDEQFDFITCQAAFKNFSQPVRAIEEMYRVLRPGGTALINDMRGDSSEADIEREVRGMNVGPLNRWFIRWTFRNMLIKRAYTRKDMEAMVTQTSFRACQLEVEGIGFNVWLNK